MPDQTRWIIEHILEIIVLSPFLLYSAPKCGNQVNDDFFREIVVTI